MSTTLDIWNMALGFIGTRTVASQEERTPEAIQCGLFWDTARKQALRDYPWAFAQSRVLLAQKPLPEVWRGVWLFAYALPNECLKAHKVTIPGCSRERHFEIVRDTDGTPLLLTNTPQAALSYTQDVQDVGRFDENFAFLLARKLAALVAVPLLKNNSQKVQELEQLYRAAMPPAHDASASERNDKPAEDSWLAARSMWA